MKLVIVALVALSLAACGGPKVTENWDRPDFGHATEAAPSE